MMPRANSAAKVLLIAGWVLSSVPQASAEQMLAALDTSQASRADADTGGRIGPGAKRPSARALLEAASRDFTPAAGEGDLQGRARVTRLMANGIGDGDPSADAGNLRRLDGLLQRGLTDKYGSNNDTRHDLLQFIAPRGTPDRTLDPWSRDSARALYFDRYATGPYWAARAAQSRAQFGDDEFDGTYMRGLWSGIMGRMREREIPTFAALDRAGLDKRFKSDHWRAVEATEERVLRQSYRYYDAVNANWRQTSLWGDDIFEIWKRRRNYNSLHSGAIRRERARVENEFLQNLYGAQ